MSQFIDYGDGRDGPATGIAGLVNSYAAMTATAGNRLVTTNLSVSVGDQVWLIQSRGSGAGANEVVKVGAVGVGSFTATTPLDNSYTSPSQAIKIPQYTPGTLGVLTGSAWDTAKGGLIIALCNGPIVVGNAFNINGNDGVYGANAQPSDGGGYRGGPSRYATNTNAGQGEGVSGDRGAGSTVANGNGGGGGYSGDGIASGGGGGNGGAGSDGFDQGSATVKGKGGAVAGNANLTIIVPGGGGGGGGGDGSNPTSGSGANGGGIVILIAPKITFTAAMAANGGAGAGNGGLQGPGGGGGGGGSILLIGESIILGSNLVTALGGVGGPSNGRVGGAGGVGRIAIQTTNADNITGTTNPAYTAVINNNLAVNNQGFFI